MRNFPDPYRMTWLLEWLQIASRGQYTPSWKAPQLKLASTLAAGCCLRLSIVTAKILRQIQLQRSTSCCSSAANSEIFAPLSKAGWSLEFPQLISCWKYTGDHHPVQ